MKTTAAYIGYVTFAVIGIMGIKLVLALLGTFLVSGLMLALIGGSSYSLYYFYKQYKG